MPKAKQTSEVAVFSAPMTVVTLNDATVDFALIVADAQRRLQAETYLPAALGALTSSKVVKSLIVDGPKGFVVAHDRARALVAQVAEVGREKYGLGDSISVPVICEAFLAELEKMRTLRQQKANYKAKSKEIAKVGAVQSVKADTVAGGGGEDGATKASKANGGGEERPMASPSAPDRTGTTTVALRAPTETQTDPRTVQAQGAMWDVPGQASGAVPGSIKFSKAQPSSVTDPLRGHGWDLDRASMSWRPKEGASFPSELRKIVSDANGTLSY